MHRGQAEHVDRCAEVPPMQAEKALRLGSCLFLRVFAIPVRLTGSQKRILIDPGRLNRRLNALVVFGVESEGAFSCSASID